MKTPSVLASFAVAIAATAAEPKNDAEAAREWFQNVANPPVFSAAPGLATTPTLDRPLPVQQVTRIPERRSRRSPHWPIPRDRIYDAPNYSIPEVLPDNMPPGTKLWRYGGGTYYLMPLVPSPDRP